MKNFAIRLLVNALALWVAAEIVSGIRLSDDLGDVLIVALVFGVVNALLKPVLMLLSLPFVVLTLGFFALVVNEALLMITPALNARLGAPGPGGAIPGRIATLHAALRRFPAAPSARLDVSGLGAAILGSIVISLVTMVMGHVLEDGKE